MKPIVSVLVLAVIAMLPVRAQVSREAISVTGDAEIHVVPDRVTLFLGVESRDQNLNAARAANDRSVRAVLDAAKRLGIAAGDTQTDLIQVEIVYNRDNGTLIDYYLVRKSIVLTLRDVDKFELVLAEVLNSGANHVHGVDFQTSQLRKYRDEARAMAVKAATEKARDLAAAANLKVGPATSISAWNFGGRSWYGSGSWGNRYGQMSQNVMQRGGGEAPEGTIALGQISVTAQVSMSFRLE